MDVDGLFLASSLGASKVRARRLHKILIVGTSKWLHRHYPHYAQVTLADIQEKLEIVSKL